MKIELFELAILALPRRDKAVIANWMAGLLRGFVGPITTSLAELQVQILEVSFDEIRSLHRFTRGRLVSDQPELVGEVLVRSIRAIGRVLGKDRNDGPSSDTRLMTGD